MLEYYRFKAINKLFMQGQIEAGCLQLRALQKRYLDLAEENAVLKANMRELEDILFLARNMVFDGVFYWLITGGIRQGPFCPLCYKDKGRISRVLEGATPRCPACGEVFAPVEAVPRAGRVHVRRLRALAGAELKKRVEGKARQDARAIILPFVP